MGKLTEVSNWWEEVKGDHFYINMAKLGEGDARWIVEERKDGANVHNWHWVGKRFAAMG